MHLDVFIYTYTMSGVMHTEVLLMTSEIEIALVKEKRFIFYLMHISLLGSDYKEIFNL